jgi:hypothetical protein
MLLICEFFHRKRVICHVLADHKEFSHQMLVVYYLHVFATIFEMRHETLFFRTPLILDMSLYPS